MGMPGTWTDIFGTMGHWNFHWYSLVIFPEIGTESKQWKEKLIGNQDIVCGRTNWMVLAILGRQHKEIHSGVSLV